jgi:hypothetical protein
MEKLTELLRSASRQYSELSDKIEDAKETVKKHITSMSKTLQNPDLTDEYKAGHNEMMLICKQKMEEVLQQLNNF